MTTLDVGGETLVVLSYAVNHPHFPAVLTDAEREIATALVEGRSNAQVARDRGTSVATVAKQVATLLRKFQADSRTHLVASLVGADHGRAARSLR
jgi:DNA-binding NarL/FixJ family response regulator